MYRTSKFERSPYYSLVKIFERIPNTVKYLPTKDLKKKQLTRYLLDRCFYSLKQFYDDT
jgi:hypothetical protein